MAKTELKYPFNDPMNDITEKLGTSLHPFFSRYWGEPFSPLSGFETTSDDTVFRSIASGDAAPSLSLAAKVVAGGSGNDAIKGTAQVDQLDGNAGNDILYGYGGNDTLNGGDGADKLYGGAGTDVLAGGAGNDSLYGGGGIDGLMMDAGNDLINGGAGYDIVAVDYTSSGALTVDLRKTGYQSTGYGLDKIVNVEGAIGGAGNDSLIGNGRDNFLAGEKGADRLIGLTGDDILLGGAGNDILKGGTGADALDGEAGNDRIFGGAGADVISGGTGRDQLYAGVDAQTDTFVFFASNESGLGAQADIIYQFDRGEDLIHLQFMGMSTSWNGTHAAANSVWIKDLGADVILYADVSGDGVADFSVKVKGVGTLSASDIDYGTFTPDISVYDPGLMAVLSF